MVNPTDTRKQLSKSMLDFGGWARCLAKWLVLIVVIARGMLGRTFFSVLLVLSFHFTVDNMGKEAVLL